MKFLVILSSDFPSTAGGSPVAPGSQQLGPRILLAEKCRISSYLGNYGAGRTIKTFSLLPGEKTKISIKTYMKSIQEAKSASSILDSFTQESSDDFEDGIRSEQTNTKKYDETFKYHAEAEASGNWGAGSAKISGGVSGGSNSARDNFAKNATEGVTKHASKASTKRDVQVNTSFETKTEQVEETSISREIENINVGRTLNFVFRQMNQEFISLLHLVDVRAVFYNGNPADTIEVTLPELEGLIEKVIIPTRRNEVRDNIEKQLINIIDHDGEARNFILKDDFKDTGGNVLPNSGYLRINRKVTSTYTDSATNTAITVQGTILSADKNVLRTDGIIVDAILGQGEALDSYSKGLQDQAVKHQKLNNAMKSKEIEKSEMAAKIVENKDWDAAELFEQVNPCCKPQIFSLWPPEKPENNEVTDITTEENKNE